MLESQFTQDLGLARRGGSNDDESVQTQPELSLEPEYPVPDAELDGGGPTEPFSTKHFEHGPTQAHDKKPSQSSSSMPDTATDTQLFSAKYREVPPESRAKHPTMKLTQFQLDSSVTRDPTARILLYPRVTGLHTSPHGEDVPYDNWVEVGAADNESEETARVLVIAPSLKQIGCTVTHNDARFRLFFNPAADHLVFVNISARVTIGIWNSNKSTKWLQPQQSTTMFSGFWGIITKNTPLADLEILPRTPCPIMRLGKRRALDEPQKELRLSVVHNLRALEAALPGNTLLELCDGETTQILENNGGYKLTRLATIKEQKNSLVWRGTHTGIPDKVIVVKVIKPSDTTGRAVIRASEQWMQEATIHGSLQSHVSKQYLAFFNQYWSNTRLVLNCEHAWR